MDDRQARQQYHRTGRQAGVLHSAPWIALYSHHPPLRTQLTMGTSIEVGIAIGLHSCGDSPCGADPDVANFLDPVLYAGPYNPQYREVGVQPYQNFTVTVPEYFYPGPPQELSLNVAHFELVSVRACPYAVGFP